MRARQREKDEGEEGIHPSGTYRSAYVYADWAVMCVSMQMGKGRLYERRRYSLSFPCFHDSSIKENYLMVNCLEISFATHTYQIPISQPLFPLPPS